MTVHRTGWFSFLGFLRKLSFCHFRRHTLEAMLCLLGVALGVAVVVAIDAAVNASVESFKGAVESLAERSTHSIFADAGTLTDEQYIELVRKKLPFPMAPVIDRGVLVSAGISEALSSFPGTPGKEERARAALVGRLLGIDPFSERSLRSFTQMQSSLDASTLRRFLTEPGEVVLVSPLASRLGVKAGDALLLTIGSRRVTAHVAGVFEPTGFARAQLTDLIIADLATAQELAGAIGQLDRIDVSLDHESYEPALLAALPPGLTLRSTSQRSASLSDLIGSYKLNLNALSLMASFVAVFIVYNSMLISVQQRVTSLGILRCVGAGRGQLASIYLAEALIFSVVGGVVGVLAGWLLSRGLVGLVATTINDLYAAVRPGPVKLGAMEFAKGLGLSTASCLIGALVPLIRASRTPPVNAFRVTARADTSGRASLAFLVGGLSLLALSYAIYLLPIASPIVGFVMAFLVALGFAFACPALLRMTCRVLARLIRPLQILPLQMAGAGVARSLGITGVAVAATMLAMAMNVSIRTMVGSFRGALGDWVGKRFAADVFIGPELLVNHKIDATLDPAVQQWVRAQPGISQVIEYRARNVPYAGKSILLSATNVLDLLKARSIPIKSSGCDSPADPFNPATDALISEPLAGRTKLSLNDTISLDTPTGRRQFRIRAIFFDFGSERGQVMLDRATYAQAWNDDTVNSLHVSLIAGSNVDAVAAAWAAELRKDYPVVANSFGHLRNEVLTVFDRTFKVTEVLTWLAGGVAFCGLAGSLLAVSLARQKDYSVLAAVGMSGRQTTGWVLAQGLILAWVSALVAAVAGTALAYVLAYVIQYRSFGWSIPTGPQPRFWVEAFLIATVAAVVAAVYPVYRLRAAAPAGSLRQE